MRVVVTGGAGFIGRPVVTRLVERGHDVRVLDTRAAGWGVDVTLGDVRDPVAVGQVIRDADALCHLAAKVGLGVDVQDTPDYADVNVRGTATVLAAMAQHGVQRLVLASSMVVYGEGLGRCTAHGDVAPGARTEDDLRAGRFDPGCPRCGRRLGSAMIDEDGRLDPRNAYAASKLAQEHFASSWARAVGGSVACLRYHNVYGPGMPKDTPYAGVAAIFRSALARGESPRVFEDGRQRRDFIHVRDVAAATVAAIERHERGMVALNVGSGTPRTIGAMAEALALAAGGPTPCVTGEFRLGDVRHITADSSRLRTMFGWHPEVDFAAGVRELMSTGD
ncbi:MAG TPA: NAD-dependent epimerase/dehydratase family protein [Mycobacteriales bacterium]|jgi:dTDP-L-rhamnose 4-epimerase